MQQSSEAFRLIVRRGPQPNQVYDLNKDIIALGRDITNDIVINDPEVSRHHLRLTRGSAGFAMEDLGSTNGTFVNGQRLSGARPLRNGDMIGLGETVTLSYEVVAALPSMGVESAPPTYQAPAAPRYQTPEYSPPPPSPAQPPSPAPPPAAQSPYAPPAQGSAPAAGQAPYSYSPPPYTSQPPSQPAAAPYGNVQPQPYGGQPPLQPGQPGYGEYDPYAVREEEPRTNTARWIAIGCAGLALFCCCGSALGLVAIDQLCLWDRIPLLYDILRAFNYSQVC